jgi:hypothetical protein
MTSLLGVNSSYDESINTFAFGNYHFIVDNDKKKIIYKESNNINLDDKEESEKISKVKAYIHNIIKDKNIESAFLNNFIGELKKELEGVLSKEDIGIQKNKKETKFFTGGKKYNKLIQECFYNFILNILMLFYQNLKLNNSANKIKIYQLESKSFSLVPKKENEIALCEEELLFCELFKSTSKYKIFFETFLQENDPHELFKIPLIFTEEFINVKIRSITNKIELKLSFFNIIDNLYISSNSNTLNITINNFYFQYTEDNLNNYFSETNIQNKDPNNLKLFTLNKNILQKYSYLLNNIYDKIQLKKIFPLLNVKKEAIHLIDRKIIVQTIQSLFEKNNLLKTSNYLIFALVYSFTILMPLFSYEKLLIYFENLLHSLKQLDFFLRFYCYIIIETFYKYYLINIDENLLSKMNVKLYFYLFISHLKEENLLPNEEVFLIKKQYIDGNFVKENKSLRDENNIIENNIENNIIDNNFIENKIIEYDHHNIKLDLNDKSAFQIFMKYNFGYKGIYKPYVIIKTAMKETGNYNIAIKDEFNKIGNNDKKRKTPTIVIKIKNDIYTSELYSSKKIFKLAFNEYRECIKNSKIDLEKVDVKTIREILVNLIQYSIELKELNLPCELLVDGLSLTQNLIEKNKIYNKSKTLKQ